MNLNHLLNQANEVAIIEDGGKTICWKTLKQHIAGVQSELIRLRVNKCALISTDSLEFVVVLLSCHYLGIELLLPPNDSIQTLEYLKADIVIGEAQNILSFSHLIGDVINNNLDSVVSIFTSGSTGEPKKIDRSMSGLLQEVQEIDSLWGVDFKSPSFVATVSNQHIYGLLFAVLWPLTKGNKINRKMLPFEETLQQFTTTHHEVVLISSPAFLKRLSFESIDKLDSLKVFCSGGVLSDQQSLKASTILSTAITQVYGSSETGGIAYKYKQSSWQFFPSVQSKIVDSILWVKSPFCVERDWLDTNDRVELNSDGFELLGRKDRIVKVEEKRVSLIQVEAELLKHPWVTEVHAVGISQERQYVAVVVVLNDEGIKQTKNLSEKEIKSSLKAFIKPNIEKLAIPRQIRLLSEIPVNTQGKIIHSKIMDIFTS